MTQSSSKSSAGGSSTQGARSAPAEPGRLEQREAQAERRERCWNELARVMRRIVDRRERPVARAGLDTLVAELCVALRAQWALVGRLDGPDHDSVQVVAVSEAGKPGRSLRYDLGGTPCEQVVGRGVCSYSSGVAGLFPEDALLRQLRIEGYGGIPLRDSKGDPIGVLVVLFENPIQDRELVESSLLFFAACAGAELERLRLEEQLEQRSSEARQRSEEELHRSETAERLRRQNELILNAAGEGIFGLDLQGCHTFVNPAAAEMLGYEPHELLGEHSHSLWHHSRADGSVYENRECPIHAACHDGKVHRGADEFFWRKDGTGFAAEYVSTPIVVDERTAGAVVVFNDVSERKRAEAELERLAMAIEQSSEVVVITDTSGTITYVNPAFSRVTGYSREEAIGQNPRILKSGVQDDQFYAELRQRLASGETWSGRIVNRRKDGQHYTEEGTISPVRGAQGQVVSYVAVKRDVTAELGLTEQILQSQKMEAIGKLAGGVAHDMNSILATVMVNAALVDTALGPEHSCARDVEVIANACRRGRDLARNLLGFSGKGTFVKGSLDLNEVVREALALLQRSVLHRVTIETELAAALPAIEGDRGQITQALINLCINAADAVSGHGRIAIRTCLSPVEHNGALPRPCDSAQVKLQVLDDGIGMDEETVRRACEPFFTTKADEGTGLGLAMVYGTVTSHGGTVKIDSTPAVGTTVTLEFPALEMMAQPSSRRTKPRHRPQRKRGGVLLVDDEALMLLGLGKLLEMEGFNVWTATEGAEAIATYRQHRAEIAVVVLDLILPGMGGQDILAELRAIHSDVKVIVASGFASEATTREVLASGAVSFVPKPFEPEELIDTIQQVMRDSETPNPPPAVEGDSQ